MPSERLLKLIALATGRANPHESRVAARKALEIIDSEGLPKGPLARTGVLRRLLQAAGETKS